jgi:hypothetical protein
MASKRYIDEAKQTITIEFANGHRFGPIMRTEVTDALTRMIGDLDARLARLEARPVSPASR